MPRAKGSRFDLDDLLQVPLLHYSNVAHGLLLKSSPPIDVTNTAVKRAICSLSFWGLREMRGEAENHLA
jgi:hypothetical protein